MTEGAILVAKTGAMFDYEGQKVFLVAGRTTVREGHPVLKGREHLFRPLKVDFEMEDPPQKQPAARKPPARGGGKQQ